jgi:hypothetical protein
MNLKARVIGTSHIYTLENNPYKPLVTAFGISHYQHSHALSDFDISALSW